MKEINEIKNAIKLLISKDFSVINGSDYDAKVIWYADEDIVDEGEGQYIVSDNGHEKEFEHNHKEFDSAFKEFIKE